MHEIDPAFRRQKERWRQRRQRLHRRRIGLAAGALVLLCVAAGSILAGIHWWPAAGPGKTAAAGGEALPQKADQRKAVYVPAIVDLPGDPLIINIGRGAGNEVKLREVPRPADLVQPGLPDNLALLSDTMLSSSERFMTTLPSSPEDFAFFQAQSARPGGAAPPPQEMAEAPDAGAAPGAPAAETANDPYGADTDIDFNPVAGQNDGAASAEQAELPPRAEGGTGAPPSGGQGGAPARQAAKPTDAGMPGSDIAGGWGEAVGIGPAPPDLRKTRIANTMSVREVVREVDRFPRTEDVIVRVLSDRTLDSILVEHHFSPVDAKNAGAALKAEFGLDSLSAGMVVAMRGYRPDIHDTSLQLVQLSVNAAGKYIGTLALSDDGRYVQGADPWVGADLVGYSRQPAESDQPKRRYRLLDAIYSTAARNDVPTGVIGEVIMLLSRSFDLNAFASPDDKLVVIYSKVPRDSARNTGRVLYAAVTGTDKNFQCFVYQPAPGGDFACMTEKDQARTITVTNGMVTPVDGVLSAPFGPSRRPGSKEVRVNKGVDWTAPVGTPVMAAFDGTVTFAGENGPYGNFIRIDHGNGKATGYAHLDHFAPDVKVGAAVKAGDIIAYVGASGLTAGPGLHFELYVDGKAVDPMAGAEAAVASSDSDSAAVEILVNRIIGVESGHNPRAKNPLSSATGLGQFIESTWIRMMNTYRPDLARSLSRAALLDLRYDPTISREMVANLARENEAHLKAHGHSITAGRLYLAHFLGPDGANTVLGAAPDASLAAILGDGVIRANPFLTGKTASYVIGWAEAKMRSHGGGAASVATVKQRIVRASPEFLRFRDAMQKLADSAGAVL